MNSKKYKQIQSQVRIMNPHTLKIHHNEFNSNNTIDSGNELSKNKKIQS
jgi:hypothetical protein